MTERRPDDERPQSDEACRSGPTGGRYCIDGTALDVERDEERETDAERETVAERERGAANHERVRRMTLPR